MITFFINLLLFIFGLMIISLGADITSWVWVIIGAIVCRAHVNISRNDKTL